MSAQKSSGNDHGSLSAGGSASTDLKIVSQCDLDSERIL